MRLPDGWWPLSRLNALRLTALAAALAGASVCYRLGASALQTTESEARQRQHAQYAASWRRLMPLRAARVLSPARSDPYVRFSPTTFQQSGARLVSRLPSDKGGELVLDTPWAQVAPTFLRLAACGMQVTAFALTGENGTLRLTLGLVRNDEP